MKEIDLIIMLSELHKLSKLMWQKKKIMKIFFFTVYDLYNIYNVSISAFDSHMHGKRFFRPPESNARVLILPVLHVTHRKQ